MLEHLSILDLALSEVKRLIQIIMYFIGAVAVFTNYPLNVLVLCVKRNVLTFFLQETMHRQKMFFFNTERCCCECNRYDHQIGEKFK